MKKAQSWLSYERFGYNDTEELSLEYIGRTSRWVDIGDRKAYFAPLAVHEGSLESLKDQLDIVKKFVPSGQWAQIQLQDQQEKAGRITNSITFTKRIVSAVRGEIQSFATKVYHEHLFIGQAETIFESYKAEIDALLLAKAGIAFDRMPKAFERLTQVTRKPLVMHLRPVVELLMASHTQYFRLPRSHLGLEMKA